MIKVLVNEFILSVVHVAGCPGADLCMCVDLPLDKKICGQSGLGLQAAAPSWAAGPAFSKPHQNSPLHVLCL